MIRAREDVVMEGEVRLTWDHELKSAADLYWLEKNKEKDSSLEPPKETQLC